MNINVFKHTNIKQKNSITCYHPLKTQTLATINPNSSVCAVVFFHKIDSITTKLIKKTRTFLKKIKITCGIVKEQAPAPQARC